MREGYIHTLLMSRSSQEAQDHIVHVKLTPTVVVSESDRHHDFFPSTQSVARFFDTPVG